MWGGQQAAVDWVNPGEDAPDGGHAAAGQRVGVGQEVAGVGACRGVEGSRERGGGRGVARIGAQAGGVKGPGRRRRPRGAAVGGGLGAAPR